MSIPNTLEAFLELGFRSGLLDKTAVDACCAQLAEHGGPPQKPHALASALVRAGMLTNFQAQKLLSGAGAAFKSAANIAFWSGSAPAAWELFISASTCSWAGAWR